MDTNKYIPLCIPNLGGNEWKYVKECLDTGWISSVGEYVNQFEKSVSDYVGCQYGIAAVNGTAAIHIALKLMGVREKDYVIIPNVTFVATANAIKYLGAEPILIDVDKDTWQLDLDLLESFLKEETKVNSSGTRVFIRDSRRVKVIMPVHVQGNIGNMDRLMDIAEEYDLPIVEDAAESLGTTYKKKHGGTFGKIGCLSFNGNKIISTGGGGMLITNDEVLAERAKHLTTTAKTSQQEYFHDEVGYNYRLVNVLAAIGVAQMELLDRYVTKKKEIASHYYSELTGVEDITFQKIFEDTDHNNWLFTIKTDQQKGLLDYMNNQKIGCRPIWTPMNKLPMYSNSPFYTKENISDNIHQSCLAIPCSTGISKEELNRVTDTIKSYYNGI